MTVLLLDPWECARVALSSSDDDSRDRGLGWAISFLGDIQADIALMPADLAASADAKTSADIAARADVLVVVGPWLPAHDRLAEQCRGTVCFVPVGWMLHPGPVVAATRHDREADAEIRLAVELARRDQAILLLAHVWGMPGLGIVDMPADPYLIGSIPNGQSGALQVLADQLSAGFPELAVRAEVRQGQHVAPELAQLAVDAGASAIVLGRPSVRGDRVPLGSIARALITQAPCPVIVVPTATRDLRP